VSSPERHPTPPRRRAPRRTVARRIAWPSWLHGPLLTLLVVVVGSVLIIGVMLAVRANRALSNIQQADPRRNPTAQVIAISRPLAGGELVPTLPPPPDALREPVNILLIGVDKRPNADEGVRSDTLILVHLDPLDKWAAMLSIPRDSVVNIPHLGYAKVNAAYSYGFSNAAAIYGEGTEPDAAGAALAAETIEQFLGVKVDFTAQVDFHGFESLVNSVGGVLVDVPAPLLDAEYPTEDYGVERIYIPAGLQVMDGHTALIYARSRHASTDFDRGRRQQTVLRALLEQVRARGLLENVATLPEWAAVLEQNIRTTLPIADLGMINGLATLARGLASDRIVQLSINPNDVALDSEDGSDLYWNQADLDALVSRWRAGPPPASQATPGQPAGAGDVGRVQVLNGAAVDGLAGRVSTFLSGQGFALIDPGQAARIYEHTTIIDYTGRPQTRQRLAEALGIDARYVQAAPGPDAPPPPEQTDILLIVGQDYNQAWAGQ
jgi:polyisoprenyl-teichoic acid--peptidoglycan teichoic acid transferase